MRLLRVSFRSPPRFSGLCFFISAYFGLFVIAGVILFGSQFNLRRNNSGITLDNCEIYGMKVTSKLAKVCTPSSTVSKGPNEGHKNKSKFLVEGKIVNAFSRSLLDLNWPLSQSTLINCTSMKEITNIEYIAEGWTKVVYKGMYHGRNVAIKRSNYDGHDFQDCVKKVGTSRTTCFQRLDAKIIKEIVLLSELAHDNVVKILGFCLPDEDGFATLVTELGEPLDIMRLLQISWEDRLQLVLGIAHILQHFAYSPLGSLSMNDFRREQFVIVDGKLKVSDLDDVGIGEPECDNDNMCQNLTRFIFKDNIFDDYNNRRTHSCSNFHCIGYNSRINIWYAGQQFVKLLLPIGAPEPLQPIIKELLSAYELKDTLDVSRDLSVILETTQLLVNHYITGKYIISGGGVEKLGFKRFESSDLPGMFDYRCRFSISAVSCVMSVYNEDEAAQFCNKDIDCKAVVLSKMKTWTGRIVAIFKNGFDSPVMGDGFTLLLKLNPT